MVSLTVDAPSARPPVTTSSDDRPVICQVLHSLQIGGAEVLAAGLARQLQQRYQFIFACLDEIGTLGEQLQAEGFPVEVLHRQPGIDWRCGLRLGAFLKQHRARLIHAHQYTPFFQSLLSRMGWHRPPIVFTEHGRHYPDTRSLKRVIANRLLMGYRDRVIAVGEAVRDALIRNEGIRSSDIAVIYNGVEMEPFAASRRHPEWRRASRLQFAARDEDFVILQVARLNPLKDHATSIRAVEQLVRTGLPVKLILAGDGEERSKLEALVRERQLGDVVRFAGARRDIPQLLAGADAFVLSSISEGIPLTLIEAMAAGVPVVATDVGGNAEVITHEHTGLLCPAQDPVALGEQLKRLHNDPALRKRLIAAGSVRAAGQFSLQVMHQQYVAVYDSLLGSTDGCVTSLESRVQTGVCG